MRDTWHMLLLLYMSMRLIAIVLLETKGRSFNRKVSPENSSSITAWYLTSGSGLHQHNTIRYRYKFSGSGLPCMGCELWG